jgi:hypothetical protein
MGGDRAAAVLAGLAPRGGYGPLPTAHWPRGGLRVELGVGLELSDGREQIVS